MDVSVLQVLKLKTGIFLTLASLIAKPVIVTEKDVPTNTITFKEGKKRELLNATVLVSDCISLGVYIHIETCIYIATLDPRYAYI